MKKASQGTDCVRVIYSLETLANIRKEGEYIDNLFQALPFYSWLHICGEVLVFFCFSAAGGARKLMKAQHVFASSGKNPIIKIHAGFFIVLSMQCVNSM